MLPVVHTELLSDSELPSAVAKILSELPPVDIEAGYWQRAGAIRVEVLAKRLRARLGDALIAQSCIDHSISLLTRDCDFRTFAETAHLNLVIQ
jgi:predicted nucleic acid-binding protein